MKKLFLLLGAMMIFLGAQTANAQTPPKPEKRKEFVVSRYGCLGANGSVKDQSGRTVSLMGPSLYWSCETPLWWCKETVNYLVDQYNIQIIRLPVAIAPCGVGGIVSPGNPPDTWNENCYYYRPEYTKALVDEVVKAAIENDIYVIIDFHEHYAENWMSQAMEFFTYFATKWGEYPNVMYEIYNEPFSDNGTVINYAKQIIPAIRSIDPDNIIIVGSANFSREPHNVTAAGQGQTNIAYSWHGYVKWGHQDDWSSEGSDSWNTTVPVIATEWGLSNNKNDGGLLDIFKDRGIINCFWSMSNIGGDEEIWSVLKSDCNKKSRWTADDMTENGAFMLEQAKGWVNFKPVVLYDEDEQEVYTEFVESTGTLTYYYDDQREERTGVTELYDPINYPDAVRFAGYNKKVTKVAIDPSMKRANLTSFRNMSYGGFDSETFTMYTLSNVTAIEGLENLNTEIVTDMNSMFQYPLVTSIDVSSFNTSNVTNMNGMFLGCNKLQTLDLTSFDVSKVKDMRMMFGSCYELTTIYCNDDWSQIVPPNNEMENMDNMYVMFSGCKKLVGGEGTPFDSNVINGTYARLDGGTASPGYFSKKPEYILGDANNSGGVEIGDITSVLTLMATPDATGYNNKAADANQSGNIEIGDITTILTIMAGGN